MFGVVIWPVQFDQGLFCFSIFTFCYNDGKEENKFICQKQSLESLAIPKDIKDYNKTKPNGVSPNIYFIYKKLLQAFLKSMSC